MPERELEHLFDELEALHASVDEDDRERVDAALDAAEDVEAEVAAIDDRGAFGNVIRGYDRADVAETVLGSLLFGIPMAVEGGTTEVGAFFAAQPGFLVATVAATLALVHGVLYVADFQDVRVKDPLLGFVPRRFVGVTTISFATAVVLLTAWGRVDWTHPLLAVSACVVAFFPMAIGAALGDILPGS